MLFYCYILIWEACIFFNQRFNHIVLLFLARSTNHPTQRSIFRFHPLVTKWPIDSQSRRNGTSQMWAQRIDLKKNYDYVYMLYWLLCRCTGHIYTHDFNVYLHICLQALYKLIWFWKNRLCFTYCTVQFIMTSANVTRQRGLVGKSYQSSPNYIIRYWIQLQVPY